MLHMDGLCKPFLEMICSFLEVTFFENNLHHRIRFCSTSTNLRNHSEHLLTCALKTKEACLNYYNGSTMLSDVPLQRFEIVN